MDLRNLPATPPPHPSVYVPNFPCAFPPRPLLLRFRSRKVVYPTTAAACLHIQPSTPSSIPSTPLPLPCQCPFTRALPLFGAFLAQSLSSIQTRLCTETQASAGTVVYIRNDLEFQKIKTILQSISIDNPQTPPGIQ